MVDKYANIAALLLIQSVGNSSNANGFLSLTVRFINVWTIIKIELYDSMFCM